MTATRLRQHDELAGGVALLHVGMGSDDLVERVGAMDRNLEPAGGDVVEKRLEDLGGEVGRLASGRRVVDMTVRPRSLARTAAAIPTDEVPPRISSVCPGCASRPTVSDPKAVCSISGTAPSVAQSSSEVNAMTLLAGTQVYSA